MTGTWAPERGEIIYIQHSQHVGKEMPGVHPLLVCSAKAFNERTSIVIGFPMTHADFHADNPFAVAVAGPKKEVGYVLAFQPKSFDWRDRQTSPPPLGAPHPKVPGAARKKLGVLC